METLSLIDFMAEPVNVMQKLAEKGDVAELRFGGKRFLFFFSPEAAQEILVKRAQNYAQNRTIFDRIQPVTGKRGLVQLSGKDSHVARAKSRTIFSTESLKQAQKITEFYCEEMIRKFCDGQWIDVSEEMTSLILKTALRIFLGIESDHLVSQIGKKFLRLNHLCGLRMRSLFPVPLFIPTFKNQEIKKLRSEIRTLLSDEIGRGVGGLVTQELQGEDLIDQCMTFLFAGHETTASSLSFTFLLLAQYTSYQEAIVREVKISEGGTQRSSLTLNIYKESLRLFPPAYMLAREAQHADLLEGVKIRKGDQILIGITELHRNPRFFSCPHEFFPERFSEPLKHPFLFIPFGAGAKSCVGERLAYLEAQIILKKVCSRFRIYPAKKNTAGILGVESDPLITLHPLSGQLVQLRNRKLSQVREERADVAV